MLWTCSFCSGCQDPWFSGDGYGHSVMEVNARIVTADERCSRNSHQRQERRTYRCTKKSYVGLVRWINWLKASPSVVSFAAVIWVVTQWFSPTNGCSLELCIPFPLSLRINNMHVTVSSCTNHISRYICHQRSRFPRNGSLLLIGHFKERKTELEWAAVSLGGTLRDDLNNGCEGD